MGALSIDMLATDLAEYLVRKGVSLMSLNLEGTHIHYNLERNVLKVPFRETHHIAGAAVKLAEDKSCTMKDLTLTDFQSLHSAFEADVNLVWDFEKSVETRGSIGGTSRGAVQGQIEALNKWLSSGK